MNDEFEYESLSSLRDNTPFRPLSDEDRYVVFSDLHMGDGRAQDDFRKNAELFRTVLDRYYLKRNFNLILNGDIEELHKFSLPPILRQWKGLFSLFDRFAEDKRLFKIIGNHDYDLLREKKYPYRSMLLPGMRLSYESGEIFIFHGHQASDWVEKYHRLTRILIRYLARPLGIKNYSTAYNSRKQFRVERRVHEFSNTQKIISLIGHTHRPLFESLSKTDSLKFKIEQLVRKYPAASQDDKISIANDILHYKNELLEHFAKDRSIGTRDSLYDVNLVIPSLFNSGCCIGKRGITSIEISRGRIGLVSWYHDSLHKKYNRHYHQKPLRLEDTDIYRMVLKRDQLSYILSRIKLLAY